MRTFFFISALLLSSVLLVSCEKEAGEGGTSTIRGTITVREYNGDFTYLRDTYPAKEEDVYIIYGDDFVYGDRFRTSLDGAYEFKYLREGTYTIFAYSKDSSNLITNEMIPVIEVVEITGKNQTVMVDEIFILK